MSISAKVVGIGESVLDILFKNNQPVAAVPGGSSFNSIVSVGRAGVPCSFVGETGHDDVGQIVSNFMQDNGIDMSYFSFTTDKSPIALAFLNDKNDAHYSFYKPQPSAVQNVSIPPFCKDDVLLFGSYYGCCEAKRGRIEPVVEAAVAAGAIICYDINFRLPHAAERLNLLPYIYWNIRHSTVVRASGEDIQVLFGSQDVEQIYVQHIAPHCPLFICSMGSKPVWVCSPKGIWQFEVPQLDGVCSTVGAGDSFNAGLACTLLWKQIDVHTLCTADRSQWESLIHIATTFSAAVCQSNENYIPKDFVQNNALINSFKKGFAFGI